jgi:hypothetical protein
MLGAPTAEMLQSMIDKEYNEDRNRYQTAQNTYYKDGAFSQDITQKLQRDLVNELSVPLKKMRAAYLQEVAKTCYPDKWMNPEMPNEP